MKKPGKKEPLRGLEAIKEYWKNNPASQENIRMAHRVYGYSLDGTQIWSEFEGGFDVRGEHVEIEGVIGFTTDLRNKKITHLTEHYTTVKTPR